MVEFDPTGEIDALENVDLARHRLAAALQDWQTEMEAAYARLVTPARVELARALAEAQSPSIGVTPGRIVAAVAAYFQISAAMIFGSTMRRDVALARHVAMYLVRRHTDMTYMAIGERFGRHWSTVQHADCKIERMQPAAVEAVRHTLGLRNVELP